MRRQTIIRDHAVSCPAEIEMVIGLTKAYGVPSLARFDPQASGG